MSCVFAPENARIRLLHFHFQVSSSILFLEHVKLSGWCLLHRLPFLLMFVCGCATKGIYIVDRHLFLMKTPLLIYIHQFHVSVIARM